MDIQLTGYLLRTTDPMSMDLLNIYVDFHAMMGGFWMNINCNYPDAYTEGKITSKNLTAVNSVDRVAPFRIPFIVTSGPEDIYFEDSNIQVWGSLSEDRAVIETTVTSDCIPIDTKNNTFTFVRTKMSMADNPGEDKFTTYYIDLVQNVHRKLIFNYISNEFTNQYKMPYPSIQIFSNLMTEISVINTTFTNVTTANGGLMVTLIKSIQLYLFNLKQYIYDKTKKEWTDRFMFSNLLSSQAGLQLEPFNGFIPNSALPLSLLVLQLTAICFFYY